MLPPLRSLCQIIKISQESSFCIFIALYVYERNHFTFFKRENMLFTNSGVTLINYTDKTDRFVVDWKEDKGSIKV